MRNKIHPFLFTPVYKDYLWGGNRFKKYFNRKITDEILAESWEISDRDEGMSIIENGYFAGTSLKKMVKKYPTEIVGKNFKGSSFPLLIKIIDAKKRLSLQVHPDEKNAKKFGGEPKNELWHFLENDDSTIFYGLKNKIKKDNFLDILNSNKVDDILNKFMLKKGSNVLVPGGCIHAINAGSLILEIQQNSNTTYRIHDWNRVDADGNSRELHINKALEVMNLNVNNDPIVKTNIIEKNDSFIRTKILDKPYFKVEHINLKNIFTQTMNHSTFHTLFVSEGSVELKWNDKDILKIDKGRSVLIPAVINKYYLLGEGAIIKASL